MCSLQQQFNFLRSQLVVGLPQSVNRLASFGYEDTPELHHRSPCKTTKASTALRMPELSFKKSQKHSYVAPEKKQSNVATQQHLHDDRSKLS